MKKDSSGEGLTSWPMKIFIGFLVVAVMVLIFIMSWAAISSLG